VLKSSSPDEQAVFDDITIWYNETDGAPPGSASNDSLLVVGPEWRNVAAASVVRQPLLVTDRFGARFRQAVREEEPDEIYVLGAVDGNTTYNYTYIDRQEIVPVFFPNASRAVKADPASRRQALAAAQLAYSADLPLVFDERQDLSLIDGNTTALQERYLATRDDITHLVAADTEAGSSALAARYAVGNDAFLVSGKDRDVAGFRELIDTGFDRLADHGMGIESDTYLTDGAFLTVIGLPFQQRDDPVEHTVPLGSDDPVDGDAFPSDTVYADPTNDSHLDVAYGRLPNDVKIASDMMRHDQEHDESVVMGEYGKASWPQVAAYRGGGMRHARQIYRRLDDRGQEATFLVENRTTIGDISASTTELLTTVLDVPGISAARELAEDDEDGAVEKIVQGADLAASFMADNPETVATALGGVVSPELIESLSDPLSTVLKTADSAEEVTILLQAVLEHEIDPHVGRLSSALIPPTDARAVVAQLLDPYPELNSSSARRVEEAGTVYYIGEGNGTHWFLPNRHGTRLGDDLADGLNQYNGTRAYRPSNISGLAVDLSDTAAHPDYRGQFLRNGSAGLLGFTAATYMPYSHGIVRSFVDNGGTTGEALRQALNEHREQTWQFDPDDIVFHNAYWRHQARDEKAFRSAVLYGNPTTRSDARHRQSTDYTRDCEGSTCTYTWNIRTAATDTDGELSLANVSRRLIPGMPDLYLTTVEKTLPQGSDPEIDTRTDTRKLETGNTSINTTRNTTDVSSPFPHNLTQTETYDLPDGRTKLVVRQAALQHTEEGTKVVENTTIQAEADQPVHADVSVDTDNRTEIEARIYSDTERNATLTFVLSNETGRRIVTDDVQLQNGTTTHDITASLPTGRYTAEIAVDSEINAGPVREDFTVDHRQPDLRLDVPGQVTEEEPFQVHLSLHNPATEPRNVSIELNGSRGVQPDFLEPDRIDLGLEPDERKQRTVTMQAFRPGNASIRIETGEESHNETVHVERDGGTTSLLQAAQRTISLDQPDRTFHASADSTSRRIVLRRPEGRLDLERGPGRIQQQLVLGTERLAMQEREGFRSWRLTTPQGEIVRRHEHGRTETAVRGNISQERLDEMIRLLREERAKLIERYIIEREPGALEPDMVRP